MKIELKGEGEGNVSVIDVGSMHAVTLRDVFLGVGIETEDGRYGVAMRDGGIEVMLDGKLLWSSGVEWRGVSDCGFDCGLPVPTRTPPMPKVKPPKGEVKNLGMDFQSEVRKLRAELTSLKLKYMEKKLEDKEIDNIDMFNSGKYEAYSYAEDKLLDIFRWFGIEV